MGNEMVVAGRVLTPQGILESGVVSIADGVIQSVGQHSSYAGKVDLDAGEHLIAPGFIDIHIHGAIGHHLMTSEREGIIEVLRYHMKHGTTGLLATTTTASDESIRYALQKLSSIRDEQQQSPYPDLGANILGVHIEGPYLNPIRTGAQNREEVRLPDLDEYKGWEKYEIIRMITIAPEMPGSETLIRYIRDGRNVLISAGHTDATFEQTEASLDWGLSHGTHFANAMSGFMEREPGVFEPGLLGAGLIHENMTVEVIADGIHVHPQLLKLIYRIKGADQIALITDAVPFCGYADGVYKKDYGDRKEIVVSNGSVRMKENGGLAGSALTMDRAVKLMASLGIPLTDVWKMASTVPARLIGEGERKGSISPGMDADLVIISNDFEVQYTLVGGHVGFNRRAEPE